MIWLLSWLLSREFLAIVVAALAITALGVYPVDQLVADVLTVIGGVIESIVDWITSIITDAVRSALPGGGE